MFHFEFEHDGHIVNVECYDATGEDFDVEVISETGETIEPSNEIFHEAHRLITERLYEQAEHELMSEANRRRSEFMSDRADWEKDIGDMVTEAIDKPEDEVIICEKLIEYVLDLCEDDYFKGYQRGLKDALKQARDIYEKTKA